MTLSALQLASVMACTRRAAVSHHLRTQVIMFEAHDSRH